MSAERLDLARKALEEISDWKFGWDGDCGVTKRADEALAAIDAIAPPVAARRPSIQEELVRMYRYKALPSDVTPGGPLMGVIKEVFESVNDNTRIIIETSNGGASLRAEKISAPVAAGSVDNLPRYRIEPDSYAGADWVIETADPNGAWVRSMDAISWGAQQRGEGKREGEDAVTMAERMKLFFSVHDKAFIELRERAEKAEADLKARDLFVDVLNCQVKKAEARVKELEAAISTDDRVLRSSVPERWKGCADPVGSVQSYIAELEKIAQDHGINPLYTDQ